MIASSLELALLILVVEFGALCAVILFKTRKSERVQQETAVAEVTGLVGAVERSEDARKEALRTTLQEIYKVDATEADGMVEEFVEREHAFYNALIGIHLGRSGKSLSDLPAELTRLIAPWLRLTPRGQVDASEISALADRNSALNTELGETRQVLERLMAEYNAAFSREQAANEAAVGDATDDRLLSMDEAEIPTAPAAATPEPDVGDEALAEPEPAAMPESATATVAVEDSADATEDAPLIPEAPAATEPSMAPDTVINLDETDEPAPAMSQEDLDALLENLGDDIFGTSGSTAQDADKPKKP